MSPCDKIEQIKKVLESEVSILVLVDVALRSYDDLLGRAIRLVSILVLVDVALRFISYIFNCYIYFVSILVLVDVALRCCELNPYFTEISLL